MPQYNLVNKIFPLFAATLLIIACRKTDQDTPPPTPTGPVTQQEVNNWILDSMRYFYLWNNTLPAKADTQPAAPVYFNQLKYTADHFSSIYNPNDPSTYPKYMLYNYGIDFSIIAWPQAASGAIGVIKLVLPGSPAAAKGLKRGSYFTRINGTAVTAGNSASLSETLLQQSSGSFTMATVNGNSITEDAPVTLQSQPWSENPIYEATTWNINGKKVAYLFYNYFNDDYNQALTSAFQGFKAAGVSELILDLRYNPGGSVAASALLSAMIAPNINEQSGFVKYSGNNNLGQRMVSFKSALSVPESGAPIAFNSLGSSRLSLPRVFVLASGQTASAAELLINNLKPYMQVILIGQNTFGKDKGAVTITDTRYPKRIYWVMSPITFYLANSKGEGGYTQGITPLYPVDEFNKQPLLPIGDNGDPLIAKAIAILTGNGRQTAPVPESNVPVYFDSRQKQAAQGGVSMPASLVR